ncbi:MAG: hypothetical protein MUE59_13170 [Thiobacillaceae bacterium]|jgi:hypothetical protein|nr:hypothetical protein [Thiobacillaceae bacterium]
MDTKLTVVRPDPVYPDAKRPSVFADGIEFQDFICSDLAKRHVILQNLSSKRYQFDVGENLQGFEIKLDLRCTETLRLSIEIAEKSKASMPSFTPSGIYRNDNSWLYIQGNPDLYFVFQKSLLVMLHRTGRYQEHELPTIRKFYMPLDQAFKYAALAVDYREVPF